MEDEVIGLAENISKLVSEGTPLEKIYIANYSDEYYFTFHRIFKLYNIPYFVRNESSLYDTVIGKYFIDNLDSNLSNLLEDIKNKFDVENNVHNNGVYNKLFNLINTYYWCNDITTVK